MTGDRTYAQVNRPGSAGSGQSCDRSGQSCDRAVTDAESQEGERRGLLQQIKQMKYYASTGGLAGLTALGPIALAAVRAHDWGDRLTSSAVAVTDDTATMGFGTEDVDHDPDAATILSLLGGISTLIGISVGLIGYLKDDVPTAKASLIVLMFSLALIVTGFALAAQGDDLLLAVLSALLGFALLVFIIASGRALKRLI